MMRVQNGGRRKSQLLMASGRPPGVVQLDLLEGDGDALSAVGLIGLDAHCRSRGTQSHLVRKDAAGRKGQEDIHPRAFWHRHISKKKDTLGIDVPADTGDLLAFGSGCYRPLD